MMNQEDEEKDAVVEFVGRYVILIPYRGEASCGVCHFIAKNAAECRRSREG